LVEPFQAIYGDPDISKDEVLHQPLVNLLIQREELSNILKKHKAIFIGDSAHTWSNYAGTGGNNAITDGLDLGKVLQEGKNLEEFYNKSYQRWKDSFGSNAKFFEDMIRPQAEWRRIIDSQNKHVA
jgi:flavin-dependent dehydrogenase